MYLLNNWRRWQSISSETADASTRNAPTAQKHFVRFCETHGLQPLPCEQHTLLVYVAYLYVQDFKISSVRVYLAAIRSLHITEGYHNPAEDFLRLELALKAIAIKSGPPAQKLPITHKILQNIAMVINTSLYDGALLWAAMTLAHFGLFRASEFTVSAQGKFDKSKHLNILPLDTSSSSKQNAKITHLKYI